MTSAGVGDANVAKYAAATLAQAAEAMRAELRARSHHPERYRLVVVEGRPVPAIRRAIDDVTPDLVVLGTRGLGRFLTRIREFRMHWQAGNLDPLRRDSVVDQLAARVFTRDEI